jgi:hypothetical protein
MKRACVHIYFHMCLFAFHRDYQRGMISVLRSPTASAKVGSPPFWDAPPLTLERQLRGILKPRRLLDATPGLDSGFSSPKVCRIISTRHNTLEKIAPAGSLARSDHDEAADVWRRRSYLMLA